MNLICEALLEEGFLFAFWRTASRVVNRYWTVFLYREATAICRNLRVRHFRSTGAQAPALALITTFSDGCLGSNNDEGRSEV